MYDSGAVAYKQALIREPQNEKYANNLGILYSMQNKTLEARDAFETAAALSDSSYGSRTMLGLIYLQTGQFELSRKVLEEAIALKPNEFGAYYHRALYYESQYDTTRAMVDYEAAIAHGGNDEEIFRRLVQLCQWSGRIPQALDACNRWARMFPNSVDPYFLAGTSYIMASKFDSASMYLSEAHARAPGSALTAYYLATALRESGQPDHLREDRDGRPTTVRARGEEALDGDHGRAHEEGRQQEEQGQQQRIDRVCVLQRVEGQVAFVAHGVVAAQIGHQRMREFVQAQRENPANQNNCKCHDSYPLG